SRTWTSSPPARCAVMISRRCREVDSPNPSFSTSTWVEGVAQPINNFADSYKTSPSKSLRKCRGRILFWRPRMAIKKEEARRAVLGAYDGWAKKHPNQASMMGGFLFFQYLQEERSDLLDFRAAGSKWQIVHGWIRDRLQD